MSPSAVLALVVGVLVLGWLVFLVVLARRGKRTRAEQTAALAATRPGWARMAALPSSEVSAALRGAGNTTPGPAALLYGPGGIELRFGPDLFVALKWSRITDVLECDLSLLGTRTANGVRFVIADGRTLEVRLLPSRELRRQHPGRSLQGAAVAELLAVRGGARPALDAR